MKKFLRRFTRREFLLMIFIPFGVSGFYTGGWKGFFAALFGWLLGIVIYNRKENLRRLKNFLRRLTNFQIKLLVQSIICVPIIAACTYYNGLKGFIAAICGWCVGELISRRIFKY